ncbi:MAG TPA: hypothetical protein VNH18_04535, partial [Bryobacteraceae bacterium]|nr:hypothetical protein [Bryobacteraceae bacterium]
MRLTRSVASYGYVGVISALVVLADVLAQPQNSSNPDQLTEVLYLVVATVLLSWVDIPLERGHLNLSGLAIGVAAILLNPINATVVGLISALVHRRRGPWEIVTTGAISAAYATFSATIATLLRNGAPLSLENRVIVLSALTAACWILVAGALSIRTGESVRSIVKHNFTPSFYLAFAYFALGALLISYVLDGSALGYFLATIVCVLALALTDTISG